MDLSSEGSAAQSMRDRLAARCASLRPFPERTFHGAGIVICAGGASIFTNAYVLLHVLRRTLGCVLPVEVWHFGSRELSDRMRHLLHAFDAETVDAGAVARTEGVDITDGWQLKSLALMWSSFEQVLLLDADQVPEADPARLFDWPQFRASGAIVWPDICLILEDNPIWLACGLEPRRRRAIESGQLLIDKRRQWPALQVALFLNENASHFYTMVYGDKDLFLMAFLIARASFSMIPSLPLNDQPWCLFQRDFDGNRLFQHRTGTKWRYDGPQDVVPNFRLSEACETALSALRRDWNGRIFSPPPRSEAAQAAERRLAALAGLVLSQPGRATEELDLLAFGEFGAGRSAKRQNWFCAGESEINLVCAGAFGEQTRFDARPGGRWIEFGKDEAEAACLTEPGAATEMTGTSGLALKLLRAVGYPSASWRDHLDDLKTTFALLALVDASVGPALSAEVLSARSTDARRAALLQEIITALEPPPKGAPLVRPSWLNEGLYEFDRPTDDIGDTP